jgi:hypothetical protein
MKPLDPALEMLEVKNCTFRINRDIRFLKIKHHIKPIWEYGCHGGRVKDKTDQD